MFLDFIIVTDKNLCMGKKSDDNFFFQDNHPANSFISNTILDTPRGMRNAIIVGEKTYFKIPRRPISGVVNILLTDSEERTNKAIEDDLKNLEKEKLFTDSYTPKIACNNIDSILDAIKNTTTKTQEELVLGMGLINKIFVLGGVSVFNSLYSHKSVRMIYLFVINEDLGCDIPLPFDIKTDVINWAVTTGQSTANHEFDMLTLSKKNS